MVGQVKTTSNIDEAIFARAPNIMAPRSSMPTNFLRLNRLTSP